jgi:hypothetical protein
MMRQGEITRQLDGLPAKFFDFLLLLMYSLLSLLLSLFRFPQLFGESLRPQPEFSVLFSEPFSSSSLGVPAPK